MPEEIQMFHLLYRTSVKGRRELAKNLLGSKTKFKISKTYNSRVAEIFAVILKSLGLRLEFIDEQEEIREYDDDTLHLYIDEDGLEYFCTSYDYMLVQRKKAIQKEILSKHSIIDKDELEKLTMEILKTRDFVLGPDKSEIDSMEVFKPDTAE